MINPAKYYNPKLIPLSRGACFVLIFVLSWKTGVCLYECCEGFFSGIKMSSVSEVTRMEIKLYFLT